MMRTSPNTRGLVGAVATASLIATAMSTATLAGDVWAHTRTTGAHGPVAEHVAEPVAEPVEVVAEYPNLMTGVSYPSRLALTGGGHAVAAWVDPLGLDPVTQRYRWRLVAATRSADGTWSAPQPVSEPSTEYSHFTVASAGPGTGVVAWSEYANDLSGVYVSWLTDGTWTPPERVGTGVEPSIAMTATGVVLSWTDGDSTRVLTRPADGNGAWSPVRSYAGNLRSVTTVGDEGAAAVVWGNYRTGRLRALYRGNDASEWEAPVSIPARLSAPAAVTVDRAGRVVVVWMRGRDVYWTRRTLAGAWSKVAEVPGPVGRMGEYGWMWSTVNGRGRVLARWEDDDNGTFVARYRPQSGWTRATLLTTDSSYFRAADEAGQPLLTGDGVALVLGRVSGDQFAWRWQPPGEPWSAIRTVTSAGRPTAADSHGRVAAALAWGDGGLQFHRLRVPTS